MALGLHEDRTVIVELGTFREVSDYAGRHVIRNITKVAGLKTLAQRLEMAGCAVDLSGSEWMDDSQFEEPPSPSSDFPLGKRVVGDSSSRRPEVDVRWHSRNRGNGAFEVFNYSGQSLLQLVVEAPEEPDESHRGALHIVDPEPIQKLPTGKSANFNAFTSGYMSNVTVMVRAIREDGSSLRAEVFVNLG